MLINPGRLVKPEENKSERLANPSIQLSYLTPWFTLWERRGKDMRQNGLLSVPRGGLAWILIGCIGLAGGNATVWAAYKVVFKNGSIIEARAKPISMEGQYRFTGTNGQFYSVPLELLDLKRTQSANQPSLAPKKYTNEDLAGKDASTISGERPAVPGITDGNKRNATHSIRAPIPSSSPRGEEYWRNRAREIQDRLGSVDKQIQELQAKIRDGKSEGVKVGMGTYTPYMMVGFENQLGALEKDKGRLQKEFAALEEEARKAGALPGWLR
jgi:hypothetical protein